MEEKETDEKRKGNKRGRPRDHSRDKIILDVTLQLLGETGYESLTIEAIAQQAKVGKATIYRRWSSKVELVVDAASSIGPFKTLTDLLNCEQGLRGQLIDLICLNFQGEQERHQHAITAIGSAIPHHKELEKRLHNDFYCRHRKAIESIIKPFLKEDHHLKSTDIDLLADIGPALMTYRIFLIQNPFERSYVERIVDKLMLPLLEDELKK